MDWDISNIKPWQHILDFFVIMFADIAAAVFAILFFEKRTENRKSTLEALGRLKPMFEQILKWSETASNQLKDNPKGTISIDLADWMTDLTSFNNDFMIWEFKDANALRSTTNKLQKTWNDLSNGRSEVSSTQKLKEFSELAVQGQQQVRTLWNNKMRRGRKKSP